MKKYMKDMLRLFLPALLICANSYAQPLPTANTYRDGDRVRKQQIEYMNLGRSGENVLWDLGEVEVNNNAVNNIDPDGRKVRPDDKGYTIILNTLSDTERKYVVLTDRNFIDSNIISQCNSQSNNFLALKKLVESQYMINVTALSETQYVRNGEIFAEYFSPVEIETEFQDINFASSVGNTTGECGNLGVTYMPTNDGKGKSPIDNKSIHININPTLSKIGAAEAFSHEGYGHAYIYVNTNGNREKAVHHYLKGGIDSNVMLTNYSIKARKETINNLLK